MNRRFLVSLFASAVLLSPVAASARSVTEIVDRNLETVSRSTFISWTIEALGVSRESADCELPYTRVPKAMKATLCTAYLHGSLDIFGKTKVYPLGAPITRGEALWVLTTLSGKADTVTDVSAFSDVKLEMEKQGVRNAVAYKWMLPNRATFFGIARPLTGNEALSSLQVVSGSMPVRTTQSVTVTVGNQAVSGSLPKQELLDVIWQILQRDYLYNDKLSDEEAAYSAAEALVKSAGDPYTTFFRPVGAENFAQQLSGEVSGIGAQVEDKSGAIIVVTPLVGSPAERAGIMTGDQILEANGHQLTGIGVDKAVSFIRGERGSSVLLKIRRRGVDITVTVVRDVISIPEIDIKWQGNVAVVTLAQFGQTTDKKIRSVFMDIAKKNPKGVILDLRNNGGGLLSAADAVVSNFLPSGSVVAKVKSASETKMEMTQDEPTIPSTTKMVVLVNKGSASASEIVAGALQDTKRATIVGETSFGKGTVQEVLTFPSGEALKVTIAEWLTPNERKINGIGIKPDVQVDSADKDAAMKRALDILR